MPPELHHMGQLFKASSAEKQLHRPKQACFCKQFWHKQQTVPQLAYPLSL
jgi:hypothetical protein